MDVFLNKPTLFCIEFPEWQMLLTHDGKLDKHGCVSQ